MRDSLLIFQCILRDPSQTEGDEAAKIKGVQVSNITELPISQGRVMIIDYKNERKNRIS